MYTILYRQFSSQGFRQKFVSHIQHAPTSSWYPGHMYKGMKQMQAKLAVVDCFLEVHDARIPISGRNPHFYSMLTAVKPHILVLNKCDLIDMAHKDKIIQSLKSENIQNIMFTNSKEANTTKRVLPKVIELVEESEQYNRGNAQSINLMIIGVPNVGKSSLINRLRNIHLNKKKATHVGAAPGITKSVLEKIKICEKPLIYLFDTPGIIQPSIGNLETGLKLALCNILKDNLVGEELMSDYLLYWLNKEKQFVYVDFCQLKEPTDDIRLVLFALSKNKNLAMKRKTTDGSLKMFPDFHQASRCFISAFRDGHFGKICLDGEKRNGAGRSRMEKLSPIVIAVTLGVVMVFAADGSITVEDVKLLKAIFCDPDNAEVARRAIACFSYLQDMPLTFFELSTECLKELPQGSNATSASGFNVTETVTKYYCETSAETMIESNACQVRRIDELHEGKHEILGVLRVIGECFANAVTSE